MSLKDKLLRQVTNIINADKINALSVTSCQNNERVIWHHSWWMKVQFKNGQLLGILRIKDPEGNVSVFKDPERAARAIPVDQRKALRDILSRIDDVYAKVSLVYIVEKGGVKVGPMLDHGVGKRGLSYPISALNGATKGFFNDPEEAERACKQFNKYLDDLREKGRHV